MAAAAGVALLVTAGCTSATPRPTNTFASASVVEPTPLPNATPTPINGLRSEPTIRNGVSSSTRAAPSEHEPRPVRRGSAAIYAIGDSIMVDSEPNLRTLIDGIRIDAVIGRAAGAGMPIAHGLQPTPKALVFALATNGPFAPYMLHDLVEIQHGNDLVVVTAHCPYCNWIDDNNTMIHHTCTPSRHCYVADFQALARQHPDWFVSDGVHLPIGGPGAWAYARVVAAALCAAGDC